MITATSKAPAGVRRGTGGAGHTRAGWGRSLVVPARLSTGAGGPLRRLVVCRHVGRRRSAEARRPESRSDDRSASAGRWMGTRGSISDSTVDSAAAVVSWREMQCNARGGRCAETARQRHASTTIASDGIHGRQVVVWCVVCGVWCSLGRVCVLGAWERGQGELRRENEVWLGWPGGRVAHSQQGRARESRGKKLFCWRRRGVLAPQRAPFSKSHSPQKSTRPCRCGKFPV